jgi:hypothetical protein
LTLVDSWLTFCIARPAPQWRSDYGIATFTPFRHLISGDKL